MTRRGHPRRAVRPILAEVAGCTACPTIHGYRKFSAEASGRRDARFMLVGEAPGIASIESGRQWTGVGGMLLRREIRRLGLDLEDLFYLTNAVKCWPAAAGRKGARPTNRSPLRTEATRCQPFLAWEIEFLRPEVIVAVGAVAARAVAGEPIRLPDDHGRRLHADGREVVVLLHPANASRHPGVWPTYRASVLGVFAELAARAGFPVVEVTAAVIGRHGRYLMTQRTADRHLGGMWEFPGGKRQPGESLEECLRREMEEELGIDVRVGETVDVVPWSYPDRRVVLHFFRCDVRGGTVRPREGQAFRWVRASELAGLPMPPADQGTVARLREGSRQRRRAIGTGTTRARSGTPGRRLRESTGAVEGRRKPDPATPFPLLLPSGGSPSDSRHAGCSSSDETLRRRNEDARTGQSES